MRASEWVKTLENEIDVLEREIEEAGFEAEAEIASVRSRHAAMVEAKQRIAARFRSLLEKDKNGEDEAEED